MPLQVLMIHFRKDMKPLQHKSFEAYEVRAFERLEVRGYRDQTTELTRMLCELSKPHIKAVQRRLSR